MPPPATDELEVSVFGPGLGECIVVHLGDDEWMVIDSCVSDTSGQPVALDYLSRLGVNVAARVKLIVVTHWHDDHIRGAARLVEAAPNAVFVCSGALRTEQFLKLVAADPDLELKSGESSGVSEFGRVLALLQERGGNVEWAVANRRLFQRAASQTAPDCEVWAMSPSSASVTRGFINIASQVPTTVGTPKRAAVSPEPNETSVVLHARVGQHSAVLGADLETGRDPARGWLAIVNDAGRPLHRADTYKVAHHGSQNADHPQIWTDLLSRQQPPVAILTPFFRGNVSLPRSSDVARIKAQTPHLYSASAVTLPPAIPRNRTVDRTVRETARVFRRRAGRMGQVQVRMSPRSRVVSTHEAATEL